VRITMAREEIARLNGLKFVPGMPVETFRADRRAHRDVASSETAARPKVMKAFRER
jgi:hypothetical protein